MQLPTKKDLSFSKGGASSVIYNTIVNKMQFQFV